VISSDCGGMQELITHNEEGWIVPIRDEDAMTQQILNFSVLKDSDIKTLKLAARKCVCEQHNEDKMIVDMMSLYKML
jgi:colanic acid/amylovoran biosynthesis glycosyltransferase